MAGQRVFLVAAAISDLVAAPGPRWRRIRPRARPVEMLAETWRGWSPPARRSRLGAPPPNAPITTALINTPADHRSLPTRDFSPALFGNLARLRHALRIGRRSPAGHQSRFHQHASDKSLERPLHQRPFRSPATPDTALAGTNGINLYTSILGGQIVYHCEDFWTSGVVL